MDNQNERLNEVLRLCQGLSVSEQEYVASFLQRRASSRSPELTIETREPVPAVEAVEGMLEEVRALEAMELPTVQSASCEEIGNTFSIYLNEVLGCGGAADVFLARHKTENKICACKRLRGETRLQERKDEISTLTNRNLRHPHIVRIIDVDLPLGKKYWYLFLEHMELGSVSDLLRAFPLPLDCACYIGAGCLKGLICLHSFGIIHGDIKPSNVLLDGRGFPKLADFGLSHRPSTTAADEVAGTARYMSPEQCHGKPCPQSDLWSFGMMFMEMITGGKPFPGKTQNEVYGILKSLGSSGNGLDMEQCFPQLRAIDGLQVMQRCFETDPARRWNASDLLADDLFSRYRNLSPIEIPLLEAVIMAAIYDRLASVEDKRRHAIKTEAVDECHNIIRKCWGHWPCPRHPDGCTGCAVSVHAAWTPFRCWGEIDRRWELPRKFPNMLEIFEDYSSVILEAEQVDAFALLPSDPVPQQIQATEAEQPLIATSVPRQSPTSQTLQQRLTDFVRSRVGESTTLYPANFGANAREIPLRYFDRYARLIDAIPTLLQRYSSSSIHGGEDRWETLLAIALDLAHGIDSRREHFNDLDDRALDDNTPNVIYMIEAEAHSKWWYYVGQAGRKGWKGRGHPRKGKGQFQIDRMMLEAQMEGERKWRYVLAFKYENQNDGDNLELLCILLMGTCMSHKTSGACNKLVGGSNRNSTRTWERIKSEPR